MKQWILILLAAALLCSCLAEAHTLKAKSHRKSASAFRSSEDSADAHSVDEHSADANSADEHSADEHSADENSADELSADANSADTNSADGYSAVSDHGGVELGGGGYHENPDTGIAARHANIEAAAPKSRAHSHAKGRKAALNRSRSRSLTPPKSRMSLAYQARQAKRFA